MHDFTGGTASTPTPAALAEADALTHLAGLLYANAAHDAETAGDEPRARKLWKRADQNLTAAVTA
ncbi:hypothetical protein [Streptomyces sp. NPDC127038]|uniref:hypothetical protein n=1 Tax=Streptomyces sp. NPDC127038 TaxID=3347114 RepID=UPI0036634724